MNRTTKGLQNVGEGVVGQQESLLLGDALVGPGLEMVHSDGQKLQFYF